MLIFGTEVSKVGRFDSGSSRPSRLWHTGYGCFAVLGIVNNDVLPVFSHDHLPVGLFRMSVLTGECRKVTP